MTAPRILVVDDEPPLLDLAQEFLKLTSDFQIDTCSSAKEGLIKIKEGNYDAIVSDYQMPEMNGIDFLKEVRKMDGLPFIIFTGRGREEVAIEAINSGADFYIKKGGEPEAQFTELANSIRQAIARRQAEKAHKEALERYKSLYANVLGMVYSHDLQGNFIDANPAALRALGYSLEEAVRLNLADVLAPEHVKLAMSTIQEILKTGRQKRFNEYRLRCKDGRYIEIETSGSLLYRDGKPYAIQGMGREITDRNLSTAAIEQANRKLNLMSRITSHDIQNQIIVLNGLIGLTWKHSSGTTQDDYLARMRQATEKIQAQLDFAAVYQGLGRDPPEWCRLDECLGEIISGFDPEIIRVDLEVNGWEIFSDRMLQRVFYNLIDNTISHGERATHVRISARELNGLLILSYEDDGVGVVDDRKGSIFDHKSGEMKPQGLMMVREILSITGMTIEENGVAGCGALFEIVVPAASYRRHSPS